MISFAAAFGGEQVLHPYNLQGALWQVIANKGSAGVDGRKTIELTDYFHENKSSMVQSITEGKYHAQPILEVGLSESDLMSTLKNK